MPTVNFVKLSQCILERSAATTFGEAIHEWKFTHHSSDGGACACGHWLDNAHHLENVATGHTIVVGGTCVQKFMRANRALMVAVARAMFEAARFKCDRCGTWTRNGSECETCARRAAEAKRASTWKIIEASIDWTKLDRVEHQFVNESVRGCIQYDRKLSEKQRAWMARIVAKHPSAMLKRARA